VAVSLDDVRHIAALARLSLDDDHAPTIVAELNSILAHMEVLSQVDTQRLEEVVGVGAAGAPLRRDEGPPIAMVCTPDAFAPRMQHGFFLVPRLATHEDPEATS